MDIQEEIIQGQLQQIEHLSKSVDYFEKSHVKAVLGEVREWADGKYKKTPQGWVHLTDTSKKTSLAEEFLLEIDPFLQERVEKIVKWIEDDYAKKNIIYIVKPWERESIYLGLVSKLMKVIGQHAKPTDTLLDTEVKVARDGSVVISSSIEREGKQYYMFTQAISAGGYNIQSYHYRYLKDTNLPKLKVESGFEKPYEEKIKKLGKIEKIQKEIEMYEKWIKTSEDKIKLVNSLSDDELLDTHTYKRNDRPTWEKVIENGADKNFDFSKEKFEASEKQYRDSSLEGLRREVLHNIKRIKSLSKDLNKLKLKMEEQLK
jgi:hypothetical protein